GCVPQGDLPLCKPRAKRLPLAWAWGKPGGWEFSAWPPARNGGGMEPRRLFSTRWYNGDNSTPPPKCTCRSGRTMPLLALCMPVRASQPCTTIITGKHCDQMAQLGLNPHTEYLPKPFSLHPWLRGVK